MLAGQHKFWLTEENKENKLQIFTFIQAKKQINVIHNYYITEEMNATWPIILQKVKVYCQ